MTGHPSRQAAGSESRTRVLMLPGLDGTGFLLAPAVGACPGELEPIVQGLPNEEPLDYEALTDRVTAVLPAGKPYVLLGESFSGPLVLEIAARRPAGLLGVVLVATFVTRPKPRWITLFPWSLLLRFPVPRFLVRHYLIGRHGSSQLAAILQQMTKWVPPKLMAYRIRLVSCVDAREALRLCPVPIFYLQASEDRLVPERALAEILRVRPDVEHRRIEAPHLVLQVAADEAWRHILPFIRRHR